VLVDDEELELIWSYDLRQVQAIIADGVEDQVLQLIDYAEQILSQRGHFVDSRSSPERDVA
jgi:hypothetical protein